jgi:hypothetical protein
MAIIRAQQARQMLQDGNQVLGPLGEDDLQTGFVSGAKRLLTPGNIGRAAAFILSGGSLTAAEIAKEIAKQKVLNEARKKVGEVIGPRIEAKLMQQQNEARGTGGYQSDFSQDSGFMGGSGTAAEMGSFADGGRIGAMKGGIMDLETGRQMYFLGKLVKKATRAVKKVVKSPIGKAALLYAATGGLGNLAAGQSFFAGQGIGGLFKPTQFLGNVGSIFSKGGLQNIAAKVGLGGFENVGGNRIFQKNLLGKVLTSPTGLITAASTVAGLLTPQQEEEAQQLADNTGIDIEEARNSILAAARDDYKMDFRARGFKADGGIMRDGYQEGSKEPVAKKTMPLLDMGGKEMDLREDGGFVPIGRMEKADDVSARLSKNEFVFTADAVRNAGDGNVDKGAEVMYNMMKNLESGGDVSEESQGLEGARKMFQTSQRLEEVI